MEVKLLVKQVLFIEQTESVCGKSVAPVIALSGRRGSIKIVESNHKNIMDDFNDIEVN
jgi:hypothetical protein